PPPTISVVSPNSLPPGQSGSSQIIGTHFQPKAKCDFGAGITVSCKFNGSTDLIALINVSSTATPGPRNVIVPNPDGQSATRTNGFTVPSPSPVSLTSVSPNVGEQGQQVLSVNLTGKGFSEENTVDFGPGITIVSGLFVGSSSTCNVEVSIQTLATLGPR